MRYNISEIEERVYALLDENQEILDRLTDYADEQMHPRTLLRALLPDAARIVLSCISTSMLRESLQKEDASAAIRHCDGGMALLQLPGRFLRMLYFRMSDWERGVTVPLAWEGEEHSLRRPDSRRVRGRRSRPAVALRQGGAHPEMEIFGTTPGAAVAEFEWLEAPEIEGDEISLPAGAFGEVCVKLAEMMRAIIKD